MPELGRIVEFARPDACFLRPGVIFIGEIIQRVLEERDGLPLLDHPLT